MSFLTASNHSVLTAKKALTKAATRFAGDGFEQSRLLHVVVLGGCAPLNPPSSCFQIGSDGEKDVLARV